MIKCSFMIACALLKNTLFCYTAQQLVVRVTHVTFSVIQTPKCHCHCHNKGQRNSISLGVGMCLYVHRSINSLSLSSATLGVVVLSNLEICNFIFASDVA